jgi:hypothetical protein
LKRLGDLKDRAGDFEEIAFFAATVTTMGASAWAKRLLSEKADTNHDPVLTLNWREAWDWAAADAYLTRIDKRGRLAQLTADREVADRRARKLFGELVRERTFYELNRRLSPSVKGALVEFVRALAKIPVTKGAKTLLASRRAARDAMGRCYDAVPCWIMPTWRVAEQLPAEIGVLDLAIIDEASQSDVTELPALLRAKKIIVVGDDRQVSPTKPFVTHEKIEQLRHHHLGDLPFNSLLEPGESIVFLSMVADPTKKTALTALSYEQRFNVAVSRARDRVVLVRSVVRVKTIWIKGIFP